ncbi:MAG: ATP synthase subunit I [Azoarcus sp.]|jgi:ATP synthase protein I|nr:ATP synthase subunit I [Azoarcus sp.]
MRKAVLLQLGAALLAVVISAVFFGAGGALSALCGGLACVLPNGFFAWRLRLACSCGAQATVSAFVAGELVKLILVVGLLMLTMALYRDVHGWALLIGLALALKANLFAFLVKT